jgi:hypothetical protein
VAKVATSNDNDDSDAAADQATHAAQVDASAPDDAQTPAAKPVTAPPQ